MSAACCLVAEIASLVVRGGADSPLHSPTLGSLGCPASTIVLSWSTTAAISIRLVESSAHMRSTSLHCSSVEFVGRSGRFPLQACTFTTPLSRFPHGYGGNSRSSLPSYSPATTRIASTRHMPKAFTSDVRVGFVTVLSRSSSATQCHALVTYTTTSLLTGRRCLTTASVRPESFDGLVTGVSKHIELTASLAEAPRGSWLHMRQTKSRTSPNMPSGPPLVKCSVSGHRFLLIQST